MRICYLFSRKTYDLSLIMLKDYISKYTSLTLVIIFITVKEALLYHKKLQEYTTGFLVLI
jgi:hypothetical protein